MRVACCTDKLAVIETDFAAETAFPFFVHVAGLLRHGGAAVFAKAPAAGPQLMTNLPYRGPVFHEGFGAERAKCRFNAFENSNHEPRWSKLGPHEFICVHLALRARYLSG